MAPVTARFVRFARAPRPAPLPAFRHVEIRRVVWLGTWAGRERRFGPPAEAFDASHLGDGALAGNDEQWQWVHCGTTARMDLEM